MREITKNRLNSKIQKIRWLKQHPELLEEYKKIISSPTQHTTNFCNKIVSMMKEVKLLAKSTHALDVKLEELLEEAMK